MIHSPIVIYNRSITGSKIILPDTFFRVNRYSFSAIGGPKEATVSARCSQADAYRIVNMLRFPVEIFGGPGGRRSWWGFVQGVEIRFGTRAVSISLSKMYNNIQVTYSVLEPGAQYAVESRKTSWASNVDSTTRYGTKDYIFSLGETLDDVAEATRDMLLAGHKLPKFAPPQLGASEGGSYSILMDLRGWYTTLDWKYFSKTAGKEGHESSGGGTQQLGTNASEQIAQDFQILSTIGWYANSIALKIRKQNSPTDNVTVQLCSGGAGTGGSVLASGTILNANLTDSYTWLKADLNTPVFLSPSTTYSVQALRSGSLDDTNYFTVMVDEDLGYSRGVFKFYDGATWYSRDPDADLLFIVQGTEETTAQLSYMVGQTAEFIGTVYIDAASGLYSNQYRDGNAKLMFYVRELLDAGKAGGVRYLARVTPELDLDVYQEPQTTRYSVDINDRWWSLLGSPTPIPKSFCPCGVWFALADVPKQLQMVDVTAPDRYFIEESEYDTEMDVLTIEPRDETNPFKTVELI